MSSKFQLSDKQLLKFNNDDNHNNDNNNDDNDDNDENHDNDDDYDDNDNNDYEYGNDEHLKSSRLFEYDQVWHLFYTAIMATIKCSICPAARFFTSIWNDQVKYLLNISCISI